MFLSAPANASPKMNVRSPVGCVERNQISGWPERTVAPPAERKPTMLTRSPNTPSDLSRRAQAQRRMRRAAPHRLFCSTNGCPTYLVPDESGRRAVCPICGLQRSMRGNDQAKPAARQH